MSSEHTPAQRPPVARAKPRQRLLAFREALQIFVLGSVVLTVLTIGLVAFVYSARSMEDLKRRHYTLLIRATDREMERLVDRADETLRELQVVARRGILRVGDRNTLAETFAERLRSQPHLSWLSFSDAESGRFTGAWRTENNDVILNQSAPDENGGRPSEVKLGLDGRREPFVRELPAGYDPRTREWYQLAVKARGRLHWTEPYFFNEQRLGVTACAGVWDDQDRLIGVFTADFFIDAISSFLGTIGTAQRRLIIVRSETGKVLGLGSSLGNALTAAVQKKLDEVGARTLVPGEPLFTSVPLDGKQYDVVLTDRRFDSGIHYSIAVAGPEDEFIGIARTNLWWTVGVGAGALIVAAGIAVVLSGRLARPLTAITRELEAAGNLEFPATEVSRTYLREIAVVSDSLDRMKAGLRSFARYVPTSVVRELLTRKQAATLGGHDRRLTIFFSDITEFTRTSEAMAPAEVVRELSAYLEMMFRIIEEEFGGTVDKFMGDGILALYNAPQDLPDHAEKGCAAALRVQESIEALRPSMREAGRPVFETRVGLHTGDVVVGNFGTPDRLSYTVIGDGVNLASRLERLNKFYGTAILASNATRLAADGGFEWRKVDRVAVFGRAGETDVYELLGRRDATPGPLRDYRDRYHEAFALYLGREFARAAERFDALASVAPGRDRSWQILRDRCRAFEERPPADGWTGAFAVPDTKTAVMDAPGGGTVSFDGG
jgi:adenylate cyclase